MRNVIPTWYEHRVAGGLVLRSEGLLRKVASAGYGGVGLLLLFAPEPSSSALAGRHPDRPTWVSAVIR